jgi:hypothetical protein
MTEKQKWFPGHQSDTKIYAIRKRLPEAQLFFYYID